jgi:hypothetical protein
VEVEEQVVLDLEMLERVVQVELLVLPAVEVEVEVEQLVVMEAQLKMHQASMALLE